MAKLTVGQTPVLVESLNRGVAIIQNLGPGDLYLDSSDEVDTTESFKIAVNGVYETAGSGGGRVIYLVSSDTSDVRVVSI